MRKRVLILCNYPRGLAPGHRFRFEQYLDVLRSAGIDTVVEPFFPAWIWPVLYDPGNTMWKALAVLSGFARRLRMLLGVRRYDFVFIHREAAPIGPPLIEWAILALGTRIVYDLDDAIFLSRTSKANWLAANFRWRSKIAYIAKHSYRVAACNPFLVDWASRLNDDVVLLPTTIDPAYHRRRTPKRPGDKPVIGWTGTRSNLAYLDLVVPVLARLQQTYDFSFRVIADVAVDFPELRSFEFVPWRLESEIEDLQCFDIGLMPVPDGDWEKGKVGFKAIQYSALEIVPVASAVGSGPEVVIDGVTGFLVANDEEAWHRTLSSLLDRPDTWASLGAAARQHILARYSTTAQAPAYIGLFH